MAHTLTAPVTHSGWLQLQGQVEPAQPYDYVIGRITRCDGQGNPVEVIDYRVWGDFDGRCLDLHASADSPRGTLKEQLRQAAFRQCLRLEIVE